jgi:peptidoglycan/LPS O-acetylase OafA/YrhL
MVLFLPQNHWFDMLHQLLACTIFAENWQLIWMHADYAAAGAGTSPVQHFWSLAIQGQFYLVWPFVILGVVLLARGLAKLVRPQRVRDWLDPLNALLVFTAVTSLASLAYANWLGSQDQIVAYFHTATRWWELGAGAILALVLNRLPALPWAKLSCGWGGLALVVSSGFLLDGAKLFPGPAALWPVCGALLVLYSSGAGRGSVAVVLNGSILHRLADISYPLYLWHWPIAVFAMRVFGWNQLNIGQAAAVLAVSIALAWITNRLIATPVMDLVRNMNPWKALAAILAIAVSSSLSLVGANAAQQSRIEQELTQATQAEQYPGALVLDPNYLGETTELAGAFVPSTLVADQDKPEQFTSGCMQEHVDAPEFSDVRVCDPVGEIDHPQRLIVVTGGSHTLQWMPALDQLGKQLDWSFVALVKAGCLYSGNAAPDTPDALSNQACIDWNSAAEELIIDMRPDAVFTLGTNTAVGQMETLYSPSILGWQRLIDEGIAVLAIRDIPRYDSSRPECVEAAKDPASCAGRRDFMLQNVNPLTQLPGLPETVAALDMTAQICPNDTCAPIVGNVLLYWDDDHLTRTYVRTLAPALLDELERKAPFLLSNQEH